MLILSCMRFASPGDHENYIVEIDPQKFPGRIIPVNTAKAFNKSCFGGSADSSEGLTDEINSLTTDACGKSVSKKEFLLCFRCLTNPARLRICSRASSNPDNAGDKLHKRTQNWRQKFKEMWLDFLLSPEEQQFRRWATAAEDTLPLPFDICDVGESNSICMKLHKMCELISVCGVPPMYAEIYNSSHN